jgi:hypothetical protein
VTVARSLFGSQNVAARAAFFFKFIFFFSHSGNSGVFFQFFFVAFSFFNFGFYVTYFRSRAQPALPCLSLDIPGQHHAALRSPDGIGQGLIWLMLMLVFGAWTRLSLFCFCAISQLGPRAMHSNSNSSAAVSV